MTAHGYERGGQEHTGPARPAPRLESPFGALQGAGNRALAGLLTPRVQRFEAGESTGGDFDSAEPVGIDTATAEAPVESQVDSPVDDMAAAISAGVDGANTAALLQQDAAGQSSGGAVAAAAGGDASVAEGPDASLEDSPTSVQGIRTDVQRDGTADPNQPRPASPGDLLDAVLALQSVKAILDRLADFAIAQLKKAGAPATVTLATFFIPAGLIAANQGLGVTKFTFKTPAIDLGTDRQGGKRSITFTLSVDVDPKTGGGGALGAELRF